MTKDCDEIGAHLREVAAEMRVLYITGILVRPSLERVERLIAEVERGYDPRYDFSDYLDRILEEHVFRRETGRIFYKKVLGKVFGNRSAYLQSLRKAAVRASGQAS